MQSQKTRIRRQFKQLYILLAFISIILWSFLAYFVVSLRHLPQLFVIGFALTLSGVLSLFRARNWKIPIKTLLIGTGGIFGYHFFLFSALRHAPAVEANLINYLWPLLIVLLTPLFFTGSKLGVHHIAGALLGFLGAALVITQGNIHFSSTFLYGYLLALMAALTWACYSLSTKRLPPFPSSAVGAFCLISGILSLLLFSFQGNILLTLFELTPRDTLNLILMGIGPLGLAFFSWDAAMKRGDPRIIGALTYLTPLCSTFILVKLGGRILTPVSAAGMIAIVSGAFIGTLDLFLRKKQA